MKLKDKIKLYKENNADRLEHTFKNGAKFKGSGTYKLHWWLDNEYKLVVNEWVNFKTEQSKKYLEKYL